MKHTVFLCSALLLLTLSCLGAKAAAEDTDINNGFVAPPSTVTVSSTSVRDLAADEAEEAEDTDLASMPLDPPYDFDPDSMQPSDFGDYFTQSYDCETETYTLLPGDSFRNEVTVIRGAEDGPSVYVVAGVHGDEEAAWQTGKLLKKIGIRAGTLYILAPANPWGAAKVPMSRYVEGKDLNRSFPGNAEGTPAQRVADAIFRDISEKQPDFVFDLHEAAIVREDRDYLGSSLIFTSLDGYDELFFDMLWATEDGELCSRPFFLYSPAPEGSINRTVSDQLGLPIVTVETFRGYPMENRIGDQLAIVQYVLQSYGMV